MADESMRNEQIIEQFTRLIDAEKAERQNVQQSLEKLADATSQLTVAVAESKQRDIRFQESFIDLKKSIDENSRKHESVFAMVIGTDKRVEGHENKITAGEKERTVMWQKINDHNTEIGDLKSRVTATEHDIKQLKESVTDNKKDVKDVNARKHANLEKWVIRLALVIITLALTTST